MTTNICAGRMQVLFDRLRHYDVLTCRYVIMHSGFGG
jgi:hypothetical protein